LNTSAPVHDQIEQMEQLITLKLQNIDENFAKIHHLLANKVLPALKRYAVATEPVREAAKFWTSFYEQAAQIQIPSFDEHSTVNEESQQPDVTSSSQDQAPDTSSILEEHAYNEPSTASTNVSFMPGQDAFSSTPATARMGRVQNPKADDSLWDTSLDPSLIHHAHSAQDTLEPSMMEPMPSAHFDELTPNPRHIQPQLRSEKGKAKESEPLLRNVLRHNLYPINTSPTTDISTVTSPLKYRGKPKTPVPKNYNPFLGSNQDPSHWDGIVDLSQSSSTTPNRFRKNPSANRTPAEETEDDSFDGLPPGMSPPVMMSPARPPRSMAELGLFKTLRLESVGLGVDDLVVGDRVTTHCFGMFNAKGAQEYTIQPSYAFSKIPDSISLAEAATIPDNLITAFYTLFNQLKLPIPSSFPTEEVTPLTSTPILIYGAGSTSGQYAVQLLQAAGYKQVLATASTKHHNYLKSIGATHTFDYNNPTLVEDVAKAVGGDGKVPLVVDCIAGETSLKTLADIVSPDGAVAILLPIKSSTRTITVKQADDFRMGLPEDNAPFAPTVKVLGVRTFLYAQDDFLKKNLASKIIPNLLKSGLIKPNRVRLLDQGTLEERIQEGLELVIRTAKKLGIKTVAVYSEVDRDALHVTLADEAYCIGPAPSAESYVSFAPSSLYDVAETLLSQLRMDKIVDVCHRSGAQAVHPGENAVFAERLAQEGIVFIGPPASAIVSMGSKSESKNIMSAAGVTCVPGYHGENQDPAFLYGQAQDIAGFPVLIKAIHGGGGKGMRIVNDPSEAAFLEALSSAQHESLKAFGNDNVLIEKYIERPRHVEVQVFADTHGNAVSLWERDCSVQRRNQKIIEEAPAPGLSPELRADLSSKAIAAAKAVNYVGAGTVEFIFDNDTEKFYFMEMNTRLQVEHPVTEMVAAGNTLPLDQASIPLVGHAFEARIYAENPRNNFLPDSGTLLYLSTPPPTHIFAPEHSPSDKSTASTLSDLQPDLHSRDRTPLNPSLRIEQGFTQGAQIGVFYDPMIAKVVVHGKDRTEALRMLRKALSDYHVVGVSTNVEFLQTLAGNRSFINAELETGFIPKHFDELFPEIEEPKPELLAQAALFVALRDNTTQTTTTTLSPWSSLSSRRFGGDKYERIISLQSDSTTNKPFTVHLVSIAPGRFNVTVNTSAGSTTFPSVPACLSSSTSLSSTINAQSLNTTIVSQRPPPNVPASASLNTMERLHVFSGGHKTTLVVSTPNWLISLGGDVLSATKGALKAPMPSLVVDVRVKVGDKVEAGQAVVVLESMKTETVLRANAAGVVKAIGCKNGEMVEEGRELVDIESCD
ncbi:hypothetical protein H0H93_011961, partial [Arthromyces matolae]